MNTVLNLIGEYGVLCETKIRCGGKLPPADEKRWAELKAFFGTVMSPPGLPLPADLPRFSASEIRPYLAKRLRVPTEAVAILRHRDGCHQARVVNLSNGGVFLASRDLLEIGSPFTLYLSGIDGNFEGEVLELTGEVIWSTKRGIPEAQLPRGMGVCFVDVPVETLEKAGTTPRRVHRETTFRPLVKSLRSSARRTPQRPLLSRIRDESSGLSPAQPGLTFSSSSPLSSRRRRSRTRSTPHRRSDAPP